MTGSGPASDGDLREEALRRYEEGKGLARGRLRRRLLRRYPELGGYLQEFFEGEDLLEMALLAEAATLEECRTDLEDGVALADEPGPTRPEEVPEIEGFRVEERLGQGGMGTVYRAHEVEAQRDVALKVMRSHWRAFPALLDMFAREARAAAALSHTHIVKVHRVGRHAGLPYYTMELCPGGTLEARLAGPRVSARWLAATLAAVAEAVAHEHARGFLHRDIKPSNVLFDALDRPLLADFGLALRFEQRMEADADATRALGTPCYMAPELAGAKPEPPSVSSDVWGLGAVLFQGLAGRPPVEAGTRTEVLARLARLEAVDEAALPDDTPRDLRAICLRCLARDPAARYAHARDLSDDLRRFLAGREVRARPLRPWERPAYWIRRRPGAAALALLTLVLATGGALAAHLVQRGAERERSALAKEMLHRAASAAAAGQVCDAGLLYAEAYRLQPSQAARTGLLAHLTPVPAAVFRPGAGVVWRLAYDPTGRYLAAGTLSGRVLVWDVAERKPVLDLAHERGVRALAFAPEEARLATGDEAGTLRLYALPEGRALGEARRGPGPADSGEGVRAVHGVAFGPGGLVLAVTRDGRIGRWAPETGEASWTDYPSPGGCDARALAVDPARTHAVIGVRRQGQGGREGEALGEVRWYDIAADRFVSPPVVHRDSPWCAVIEPEGQWALTSDDVALYRVDRRGHHSGPAIPQEAAVGALALDPTGHLALAGDTFGQVRLWNLATGQPLGPTVPHEGPVYAAAFDPRGARFATGGAEGVIRVWDLPLGPSDARRYLSDLPLQRFALAADGAVLAGTAQGDELVLFGAVAARDGTRVRLKDRLLALDSGTRGWWVVTSGAKGLVVRSVDAPAGHLRLGPPMTIATQVGAVADGHMRDDGHMLWIVRHDRVGEVWTRPRGSKRFTRGPVIEEVIAQGLDHSGRCLLTSRDLRTYEIRDLAAPGSVRRCRMEGVGQQLAVGPGGRRLAVAASGGRGILLYDTEGERPLAVLPQPFPFEFGFPALSGVFVTQQVTAGHISFWSAEDGTPLGRPLAHRWSHGGVAQPALVVAVSGSPSPPTLATLVAVPDGRREIHVRPLHWLDAPDDAVPSGYLERARLCALRAVTPEGGLREVDDSEWWVLRDRLESIEGRTKPK